MEHINTQNAPKAVGPYSQAVLVNNILYTSGQIAIDPNTQSMIEGDIIAQTEQVIKNLSAVLEEAGFGFEDIVKTTCFLANMSDFALFNSIYEKYFVSKPARSCVAAKELPKNALAEIEVIAIK